MSVRSETHSDQIAKLWLTFRETRDALVREQLVKHYLSLVKFIAGRIAINLPQHVDKDDLLSNGFFGLLDAIDRFDIERNVKFETYAATRIRGAILDALRAQDWLPATIRQKARQYECVVADLESTLGRSATDQEIAASMGITADQLQVLLGQLNASTLVPLEDFLQAEPVSNDNIINPSQSIEEDEVKQTLAKAIDKLPEKKKKVVALYYYEGLTLKEISLIMQLSEARISQLHTKAVFRLRGALSRIKASLM